MTSKCNEPLAADPLGRAENKRAHRKLLKSSPIVPVEAGPNLRTHVREKESRVHCVLALLHVRRSRHMTAVVPRAPVVRKTCSKDWWFRRILEKMVVPLRAGFRGNAVPGKMFADLT